jgi:phosphoserine/homoserine phosphotransferase
MPPRHVVCVIDLEGTLTPEVWPFVAEQTGIQELRATTREIPSFEQLMSHRIRILAEHKIKLPQLLEIIDRLQPRPLAKEFLDTLRSKYEVILFSDTVDQIANILKRKLGNPTLFCNTLDVSEDGTIKECVMRLTDGKRLGVEALRKLNFTVLAIGDSYNDSTMLKTAHAGFWIHAPSNILKEFPEFPLCKDYDEVVKRVDETVDALAKKENDAH